MIQKSINKKAKSKKPLPSNLYGAGWVKSLQGMSKDAIIELARVNSRKAYLLEQALEAVIFKDATAKAKNSKK